MAPFWVATGAFLEGSAYRFAFGDGLGHAIPDTGRVTLGLRIGDAGMALALLGGALLAANAWAHGRAQAEDHNAFS